MKQTLACRLVECDRVSELFQQQTEKNIYWIKICSLGWLKKPFFFSFQFQLIELNHFMNDGIMQNLKLIYKNLEVTQKS